VRSGAEERNALVTVAERLGAANVYADVVSLNGIAGKVAAESDAAITIAGDNVARGRGRPANQTVVSAEAYTRVIPDSLRASDISPDEVTLHG
jgi:hypothetical protein